MKEGAAKRKMATKAKRPASESRKEGWRGKLAAMKAKRPASESGHYKSGGLRRRGYNGGATTAGYYGGVCDGSGWETSRIVGAVDAEWRAADSQSGCPTGRFGRLRTEWLVND